MGPDLVRGWLTGQGGNFREHEWNGMGWDGIRLMMIERFDTTVAQVLVFFFLLFWGGWMPGLAGHHFSIATNPI